MSATDRSIGYGTELLQSWEIAMEENAAEILRDCRRAHRRVADRCEVADIVQEAHIELWRRWPTILATARNLRAVVRTVARHAAHDYAIRLEREFIPSVDATEIDDAMHQLRS